MARISNCQVRAKVDECKWFRTHNDTVYGEVKHAYGSQWYVVYSYGPHFPMYVRDMASGKWYGNQGKASRTTSRHQSTARPTGNIEYLSERDMEMLGMIGPDEFVRRKLISAAGI